MRCFTLLLAVLALLSACGFQPRGTLPDSFRDKTVTITGLSSSTSLYQLFVSKLNLGGGKLAKKPSEAALILHVIKQRHIRRPITLSQLGRANMFDLNYVVEYELLGQKRLVLAAPRELAIRREYFNTQSSPLGQSFEEQQYRSEMEAEAASILLRQVASLIEHPREPPQTQAEDLQGNEDSSPNRLAPKSSGTGMDEGETSSKP